MRHITFSLLEKYFPGADLSFKSNLRMLRKDLGCYILIVIIVAVGFCLYRSSTGFVWDDTPRLIANLYDSTEPVFWGQCGLVRQLWVDSFSDVGAAGYRPLSALIRNLGVSIFSHANVQPCFWFFFVGLILGCLCISLYLVTSRYLKTRQGAILAVVLFIFSAPVVTGSWIVFAGIQALVPLMICTGLLLYWKIIESEKHPFSYMVILCLVFLLGPWLREFIGCLALLIIFLEMRRARRPTILMGISFLFFLHALFPTLVIKLLFIEDLPPKSIFLLGLLRDQVGSSSNRNIVLFGKHLFSSIRWQVPSHFLTLFPPIIISVVLIDYMLLAFRGRYVLISRAVKAGSFFVPEAFPEDWMTILKNVYLPFCFTVFFILGIAGVYQSNLFYLLFCSTFFLQGLRTDGFLALWFLLFFSPFLWVFTEQVHLAYAMLPASIITAGVLENIYQQLHQRSRSLYFIAYLLSVLIAVSIADHALNLYGSYKAVNGISDGIRSVSHWVRKHIPKDSIIVTNALHLEDIRFYADDWARMFYTVQGGIARDEAGVTAQPEALEKLLKQNCGKHDVYFVDVDFDYTSDKVNYHSHKYIRSNSVAIEDLGVIHITQMRYPYLDPFKACISRPYISFLGPPDLENDFYRGPAQDGTPFMREVYAEYHVYRVTGTKVDRWVGEGPLKIVRQGYKGFNILCFNGRFFAIPQGEGQFDLKRIWRKQYSHSFVSNSYHEILKQIDNLSDNNRS